MEYRNGIFVSIALALSATALAGLVGSDGYAQAAGAEAAGNEALLRLIAGQHDALPLQPQGSAGAVLVAVNGVTP